MSAVTFDTLKFVETLEAANISGEQARAIAAAVRDVQVSPDVASKADVAAVQADVVAVRADVRVLSAKFDMLKWMVAGVLAGVLALVLKSFF